MHETETLLSSGRVSALQPISWFRRFVLGITIAGVLSFMLWTASSANNRFFTAPAEESDYFNLLARGFRAGKLSLDYTTPKEMLELKDPYDPAERKELGLHDASYFKGRYYLYFGPAPVLLLFVPFQIVTGKGLQLGWATYIFSAVGYLALAATWLGIWRRYFRNANIIGVVLGLLVLGCCTMVPSALRRSHIWEMPISAGFCFASLSFLATYVALHRERRTWWFASAGVLLGLAVASRAVYVVGMAMPATALLWLWWHGRFEKRWCILPDASWWRPAIACAATLGGIGCLLLLYNYLRFENPLEFGMKYQLTAIYESKVRHFSVTYWPFNFRLYFLNPAKFSATYPYLLPGIPPNPGPKGYLYSEWVTAMLPNFPVFVLVLAAVPAAVRHRDEPLGGWLFAVAAFAIALSGLLIGFVSSADRYMVDFLPAWALIAGVGLLYVESIMARKRVVSWVVRLCCIVAALTSIAVGIEASIESEGVFSHENPKAYRRVALLLNSPRQWLRVRKEEPSRLILPAGAMVGEWGATLEMNCDVTNWSGRCFPMLVVGRHEMADTIVLLVTPERQLRVGYDHWGDGRLLSQPFGVESGAPLTLQIHYSALDEGNRDRAFRWLTVTANGREAWRLRVPFFATLLDEARVGENEIGATTCEKTFPNPIRAHLSINQP